MLVLVPLGFGLLVGVGVATVARLWPASTAPRVPATVAEQATRHATLRRLARARVDPAKATGLLLTAAVVVAVAAMVGVGVLVRMIRSQSGFSSYDVTIARWAGDHATSFSTNFLRQFTQLGGTAGVIAVSLVVIVIELRRNAGRIMVPFAVLVVGGQFALSNIVKWLVDRARPDIDRLTGFAGSSFPSGHATASAATYAALALLLGRGRSRAVKAALSGVAAGLAVAVATTRVLLGVHWFTDVLGGLLLGWGWFVLCSIAFGGRVLKFGAPIEAAERAVELQEGGSPPEMRGARTT